MSSLAVPAMAVAASMILIAVIGRAALPGQSLYPVRKVLRSAGLATAPTTELQEQLDDAELLLNRAQAVLAQGDEDGERFAVAALMSLGRAEGYLNEVDAAERLTYEAKIELLRTRAVLLIQDSAVPTNSDDHGGNRGSGSNGDDSGSGSSNSGSGSDDASGSDSSGSGSSGSGSDDSSGSDSSGSGSDDSGSGSDSSGSGSSGSDSSGSGSDDSGSGSDSSGPGSGD
jgi:hypothetical protein